MNNYPIYSDHIPESYFSLHTSLDAPSLSTRNQCINYDRHQQQREVELDLLHDHSPISDGS